MPRNKKQNVFGSILFNGSTTSVAYSGAGVTGFATASSFSGWCYIKKGSSTTRIIVGRWGAGGSDRAVICFQQSGPLGSENYAIQSGYWDGAAYTVGGAGRVPVETWFHVAFTWDGATAKAYINGTLLTGSSSSPASGVTTGINLGNQSGAFWYGNQCRTKLYTRVLTAEEIGKLATFRDDEVSTDSLWISLNGDDFDGTTAPDTSGNGRHATVTSGAISSDTPGYIGFRKRNYNSSLAFNGSSAYVALGSSGSIAQASDAFSCAAWFKYSGGSSVNLFTVVGAQEPSNTRFSIQIYQDKLQSVVATTGTLGVFNGNTVMKRNEWIFGVLTYDGANARFYINGVLDQKVTCTGTCTASSAGVSIGRGFNNSRYFVGNIARVQYWRDRALSLEEIRDIYCNGADSYDESIRTDMDGEWLLDEGAGLVANDTFGNNNGTITNATYAYDTPFKSRVAVNGNMIKNGDFEYAPPFTAVQTSTTNAWIDGTAAGSATNDLFGWAGLRNATGVELRFDPTVKYSGSYSLKLSTTDTTGRCLARLRPSATAANALKYCVRVAPNTSYIVTARIKTNNVVATTGGTWVRLDGAGAGIGSDFSLWTGNSSTQDWTLKTTTITTGPTDAFADIYLVITNSAGNVSDAWYDDISITPVYPEGRRPANGNLVENFDFEVAPTFVAATATRNRWIDGTSGGSTANTTYKWALNDTNSSSSNVTAQFDTVSPNKGLYSMKLSTLGVNRVACVATAKSNSVADVSATSLRINPNTSYTYSVWMKTNYVSGDSDDGAYVQFTERNAAASSIASTTTTKVKTTTGWTKYTGTFTSSATTVYLDILLFVRGTTGAATLIMDAWFDDIYLAPTTDPGRIAIN